MPQLLLGARGEDRRVTGREIGRPRPLDQRRVLDEAGEAELADRGAGAGLLAVEAVGGVAQGVALLAQEGQEHLTLVDEGGNESRHDVISVPGRVSPASLCGDGMVHP